MSENAKNDFSFNFTETSSFLAIYEILEINGEEASYDSGLDDPESELYQSMEVIVIGMVSNNHMVRNSTCLFV